MDQYTTYVSMYQLVNANNVLGENINTIKNKAKIFV